MGYLCEIWINQLIIDYFLLTIFRETKKLKLKQKKTRTNLSFSFAFYIFTFFSLIILGGCAERQLVRPTPQMDIEKRFWIRVLLLDNVKTCTLKINSSLRILDHQRQTTLASFNQTDMPIKAEISAGKITIAGRSFTSSELIILPDRPHTFNLNGNDYRGKLKLVLNPDKSSFDAVNLVPLEPYLAGVVGAEMYSYWEPEALKAQAIAARTYCLYIKKRFGSKRSWDVSKTQANQVYLGLSAESSQVWNAVNKTHGQLLVCSHHNGTEDIFPAYYSSSCGGHTENSQNVFGGDYFEPLAGVRCPYCKDVVKPNSFFWPMVRFGKTDVTARLLKRYTKLKELGEVTKIIPAKQSDYGKFSRLTRVKLVGSTGKTDYLRAEDLRLTIDPTGRKLKSTILKILSIGDKWAFLSGRGYGHGVGMCQYGAQAMARRGKTARQILSHYYPSSEIVEVY